jgi:hypothetical protein
MAEQEGDWLEGATIEARAENLEIPGQSIPLDIEIPDDENDTPVA